MMESLSLPAKARVLIVDSSQESRDILRTLLNRQGAETLEASQVVSAGAIAHREQPDLIVCDADCDRSPSNEDTQKLASQASRNDIPIVVLGTLKRDFKAQPGRDLVSKPYHYASLLRRIDGLLGGSS